MLDGGEIYVKLEERGGRINLDTVLAEILNKSWRAMTMKKMMLTRVVGQKCHF